ncbi:hypothetical protein HDV01_007531 [Terramyces sp. JEL0728]|nr:hypothetical protein HDV01_007531 [Terramyces sp. JEL0728]
MPTVVLVGAGQRGNIYCSYALQNPKMKIIAVAEPNDFRRQRFSKKYNAQEFKDYKKINAKIADCVLICCQDALHTDCLLHFAALKYDILLEKPMATTAQDCLLIYNSIVEHQCLFAVGHVLRYTKFNQKIKQLIRDGRIGKVVNIQHLEPVGNWHFAHSYVRGNWHKTADSCFSLMTKSCHDIDIINWFCDSELKYVSSFGSLNYFKKSNKPKEAGTATRCVDCNYEQCCYSAEKIYKPADEWPTSAIIVDEIIDVESLERALRTTDYGKCVYECDNDVVDNQVVNMQFKDITVTFTMVAHTQDICQRKTRIFGTDGEIDFNGQDIKIYNFTAGKQEIITRKELDFSFENHGAAVHGQSLFNANGLFYQCNPAAIFAPNTTEQVQALVQQAIANGTTVKAYAAGHSRNNVMCTDGATILTTNLNKFISVDHGKQTVTVGGGMKLLDFSNAILEYGYIMPGVPDYGGITVAGAIGTGAHGSSLKYPSSTHDYLVSAKIVTGTGEIVNINESDPDFPAVRVNLGALGILTEVTMKVLPVQKIKTQNIEIDFNNATLNLPAIIAQYDFAGCYYFPYNKRAILTTSTLVDASTTGNGHKTSWDSSIPDALQAWVIPKVLDVVNGLLSEDEVCPLANTRAGQLKSGETSEAVGDFGPMYMGNLFHDIANVVNVELNIPISKLAAAYQDIIAIVNNVKTCFPVYGIYTRFATPGNTFMGPNGINEPIAHLEIHILNSFTIPYLGFGAIAEIRQLLNAKYNAEPHYGKNWGSDFTRLDTKLGSRAASFAKAVKRFDPNGVFSNKFLQNLQGNAQRLATKQCAFTQDCFCAIDSDCPAGYGCVAGHVFTAAKVCRKSFGTFCERGDECASGNCVLYHCI